MTRGGLALHRRISDPLPAEGRWGTALLVDSNIGMGGDLEALLRRCHDLIAARGLVICEVDPTPDRDEVHQVVLSSDRLTSTPLPWGRIGARTLARVAWHAGPDGDRGVVRRRPDLRHPSKELAAMSIARPRQWPRFSSTLRSTAVTARVGRVVGIAIGICFLTGLLSHYQYAPWAWLPEPASPIWAYRVTQGLHVAAGTATIPLVLLKLWTVYPNLFRWPPIRSIKHAVERGTRGDPGRGDAGAIDHRILQRPQLVSVPVVLPAGPPLSRRTWWSAPSCCTSR